MTDVTDQMSAASRPPPRPKSRLMGELPVGAGTSSAGGGQGNKDFKTLLIEQKLLSGSSGLKSREVHAIMQETAKTVGDVTVEWEKRMDMLKTFRHLCADPQHHSQIVGFLPHLMPPLQFAVKDPRSQVCREACMTVAFIALQLGNKSEYFMEHIMESLFNILVANAKVVSTTSNATILLIYESVITHRLIPPLQTQMQSKSKEIRRAVCNVIKLIFQNWPPNLIQKNIGTVIKILKKGILDADGEARILTRSSFPDFRNLFPQAANQLLDSLDLLQRRQLESNLDKQQLQEEANNNVTECVNSSKGNLPKVHLPKPNETSELNKPD